jgi:hypothetical protein
MGTERIELSPNANYEAGQLNTYLFLILYVIIPISFGNDFFQGGVISNNGNANSKFFQGGIKGDEHDDGNSIPFCPINITISVSKEKINRSEQFILTFNYFNSNRNGNINISNFNYDEYLNKSFRIVRVNGKNETILYNKINIDRKLNVSENKTKNWTLETRIDIGKGPIFLFDSINRDLSSIEGKSGRKTIFIKPNIGYFGPSGKINDTLNIKMLIKNKEPEVDENGTKVIIDCTQIGEENKLLYWDYKNPLKVNHIVSAHDIEDGSNLQYIWTLESDNNSCDEFITNLSTIANEWDLQYEKNYRFMVKARDLDGNYSRPVAAKILSADRKIAYKSITMPSWRFYSLNIAIMILLSLLISIIALFMRVEFCIRKGELIGLTINWIKKNFKNITTNTFAKSLLFIVFITLIFGLLLMFIVKLWGHVYFISLAFYEFYAYLIIFILYEYLAEEIFFKTDTTIEKNRILFINNLFMIFILISFYYIYSGISESLYEHLYRYYSNITQVYGTLLGIILGFYVAKFDSTAKRSENYLKTLEYLVVLFGSLIGLSFWGLSSGATIYFTPLIEFNPENLPNIFSIWIFESTLLLIPMTITSLYRLIKAAN